jgi:hypothetical protein
MLAVLAGAPALGQQPSPEQVSAIRSSCRSDFMSRCAGVTPGGADALACLRKNVAQLSPGCQAAVNATSPKPAAAVAAPVPAAPAGVAAAPPPSPPAAAPVVAPQAAAPQAPAPLAPAPQAPAGQAPVGVPSSDQVAAIRAACPSDFTAHCAGVPPGGLEGLSCLQRNAAKLSAPCRFAVTSSGVAAPAQSAAAPAAAPAPPAAKPAPVARTTAPAAPAVAPAAAPTAQQQAAIRASCQADFMSRCAGVQPGGADALACLKRNAAQLSAPCRSAIGALGAPAQRTATATPAAAPAPAAAAPVAAAAAAQPTADQQAAIRASCRSDFMSRCSGVQPGGADALACLKRNEAQLSSACRSAVGAIGSSAAAPAAAAAAPTAAQQSAIKSACQRDFMMNCRGVQPGGQEAFMCLQRNSARLSPGCQGALAAVASGTTPAPVAAAPPPAARPPGLFPVRRAIRERLMGN